MQDKYTDDGMDSFWNLERLVPARKKAPRAPFATSVSFAEVGSSQKTENAPTDNAQCRFSAPPAKTAEALEEVTEHTRPDNRFIPLVRVRRRSSDYNFYGQFCRDARRYYEREGEACAFAPYFSYIPQYAQLTPDQLAYYLYWRSSLRHGEYIRTEESYFYLYVYEIINLPDVISPKDGINALCDVWAAYRKDLPRVDKFMTEWVMDYCLVHDLPCPFEKLRPFLAAILPLASHKEFYLGAMGDYSCEGRETALAFFSTYRFRTSRYAQGENAELFATHILSVMGEVLSRLLQSQKDVMREAVRTVRVHEAFCGALCAQNVRCRLEVTYYAIQDVSYLRSSITAAVKYAENKLRAALSIKSRLAVPVLDAPIRERIDAYFARVAPSVRPVRAAEIPTYERLYDAPQGSSDLSHADDIERESWATTRALVPDEEWEEIQKQSNSDIYSSADDEKTQETASRDVLLAEEKKYLRLLLAGDGAGVRALLARNGLLEDEIAGAINEKSMEHIGDVILEMTGEGYSLLPDYAEEVSEWIR